MTRDGVERFMDNISTQLLLEKECNWGEMLGAAPRALCSLGQCFVAATSSPDLAILKLPNNGDLKKVGICGSTKEYEQGGKDQRGNLRTGRDCKRSDE
ncbi:predicted protein [Uncinocarpus reesii 1704]|uniref:Uncharacterized protein n=1 Tax=Uncinocarpus reesii (strain UAMH 1704) TaxID=336963 RepID=C4JMJ9_UNCRE|nr:uncharacterized protein UREG_04057 [Uncinocarpus reesii 1704]EEP79211.1 predicted protein [Uncinocarpus reesii 1704]